MPKKSARVAAYIMYSQGFDIQDVRIRDNAKVKVIPGEGAWVRADVWVPEDRVNPSEDEHAGQ